MVQITRDEHFHYCTFRCLCAVPNMAAFHSSFTSCFPGMSLRYLLIDFQMVLVSSVISGITLFLHSTCVVL